MTMKREYMKVQGIKVLKGFGDTPEEKIQELMLFAGFRTFDKDTSPFTRGRYTVMRVRHPEGIRVTCMTESMLASSVTEGRAVDNIAGRPVEVKLVEGPVYPDRVIEALVDAIISRKPFDEDNSLDPVRALLPEPAFYTKLVNDGAVPQRTVMAKWVAWFGLLYPQPPFNDALKEAIKAKIVGNEFPDQPLDDYECRVVVQRNGDLDVKLFRVEKTPV